MQFARDPNQAEAAGAATPQGSQQGDIDPGISKPTPEAPTKEPNTKFKTDFREDAKIWELYLDDAERVARERVGLWNTGLDSILIFAGLLAGVVASFVVEVTVDSNGNSPTPSLSMQSPSTRSLWTTGLWCCSLIITIFGAIMGVLAKTWISNFIPVSRKRGAEDAYKRLMLDKQADHLRLGGVILFIPLLVQIASYLFAAGFAVILFDSNTAIGTVVAVLVGIGAAAYLITTFIAARLPETFPFRTPLSDILKNLKYLRNLRSLRNSKDVYNVELAEIWLEKLIESPNPSTVNETIAELARQWDEKFFDQWRDNFCHPDVLNILLGRIKDYVKPEPDYARDELYLHMECLMHLVRYIELKPPSNINSLILQILQKYLEPDGPLYCWNVFREDVRPLAFCLVRTHIMILLAKFTPFILEGILPLSMETLLSLRVKRNLGRACSIRYQGIIDSSSY
ncbi:hypothetical protein BDQ17DRAFT_1377901 [Cyathus striatus]|nr:hypothetical protein BDQ17DRAFT_1377901 [Cyathus striatus]